MWKSLKNKVRKSLECCKWSLVGSSGEGPEDQNADRTAKIKDQAHEVSDVNKAIRCYIQAKNLATICLLPCEFVGL